MNKDAEVFENVISSFSEEMLIAVSLTLATFIQQMERYDSNEFSYKERLDKLFEFVCVAFKKLEKPIKIKAADLCLKIANELTDDA